MSDFDSFWARYPRKVGKLDAMRAYRKALTVSSADEILAGVENYRQHLPDDVRYVAHPSTWLNQGRWMDEYDDVRPARKPGPRIAEQYVQANYDWFEECKLLHGQKCNGRSGHQAQMDIDEARQKARVPLHPWIHECVEVHDGACKSESEHQVMLEKDRERGVA